MGTFGCQPTDGVAQKSTIAKGYFEHLRKMANVNENVGRVKLPEAIQLFKGSDRKCETLCAVEQFIYLDWHDRVTPDDGCGDYFFNAAKVQPSKQDTTDLTVQAHQEAVTVDDAVGA